MGEAGATSVNENTTTQSGPIEKTGSSSDAISFDDLEAITDPKAKVHSDPVDKPKKAKEKIEDPDEKPGKKDPKTKDKQDEEPGESKNKKKVDEKEEVDDADKPKTLKIKNGDADLDVRADAKIKVKIDGKEEEVSFQDIVNEYSGKQNWGRKYQQLDTERKAFETSRQELQSGVDDLYRLAVTDNKPFEAVQMLSEMMGGDGIKVVTQLRELMLKQLEEYASMTPEQREIRKAQEEKALLESKLNRRDALDAKRKESDTIAKRVADVKAKHSMDDARFSEIYKTLQKSVDAKDLTPELIGEVSDRWKAMDTADEVVADLGLEGDQAKQASSQLFEQWKIDKSLTKAQLKYIAEALFKAGKKTGSMKTKMERNGQGNPAPAAKKSVSEANFFDDLE